MGQKRQLEGSKPDIEYLEGVAGPKETVQGTEALPRIS
jgi:hypothetical protein